MNGAEMMLNYPLPFALHETVLFSGTQAARAHPILVLEDMGGGVRGCSPVLEILPTHSALAAVVPP